MHTSSWRHWLEPVLLGVVSALLGAIATLAVVGVPNARAAAPAVAPAKTESPAVACIAPQVDPRASH